jgi:small subunit ribosomal protein S4
MARYIGPKQRLQRQIGEDLGLKTNALKTAKRITIRPGQHGQKMRRKISDYGRQLKEKQKVKYIYGILERQIRKVYEQASKDVTSKGAALLTLLERRLDNVVYRLGFASTRAAARQYVAHNHVLVNNKKMNIPSYQVKVDDVVSLKPKAVKIPAIDEQLKKDADGVPSWLLRKAVIGKIVRLPERDDIKEGIEEQLIVEFYSR